MKTNNENLFQYFFIHTRVWCTSNGSLLKWKFCCNHFNGSLIHSDSLKIMFQQYIDCYSYSSWATKQLSVFANAFASIARSLWKFNWKVFKLRKTRTKPNFQTHIEITTKKQVSNDWDLLIIFRRWFFAI